MSAAEVRLVTSSSDWPAQFHLVANALHQLWGARVRLEHIGSTSVVGLEAKPIIDVMAGSESLALFDESMAQLAALGFERRAEHDHQFPERRYLVRLASGDAMRVNLHAVVVGSRYWQRHLAFRDALRNDPLLAQRYADVKRRLATAFRFDRAAYTAAKSPFIESVLASMESPDMSDLSPLPPTPLGRYRHYKGGDYEVVGVARHSETHEPLVVYRPLYNATGWWVRPHAMFFEAIEVDGKLQPRFTPIAEPAP